MKLKVLPIEESEKYNRRVVINHDESGVHEWVRDECDNLFSLYSTCQRYRGDRYYNESCKAWKEVDSPFEEDENGNMKQKDGLIVIPVDVYEHSFMTWFIRGETPAGCGCPFDSTCSHYVAPFYLYCDQKKWESWMKSKWVDGKPTKEIFDEAFKIARSEIKSMNLCEEGSYYEWREDEKVTVKGNVTKTNNATGVATDEPVDWQHWEFVDHCGSFLTDEPLKDMTYPCGVPVFSETTYLVGDTFEQECWAFVTAGGEYVTTDRKLSKDVKIAYIVSDQFFLESNRHYYEEKVGTGLSIVNVTKEVWNQYPDCHA